MSTYHLMARLFIGPSHQPKRNEKRSAESDSWEELEAVAHQLAADGFTVWLYDHGSPSPILYASDFRLLRRLDPKPSAPRVGRGDNDRSARSSETTARAARRRRLPPT